MELAKAFCGQFVQNKLRGRANQKTSKIEVGPNKLMKTKDEKTDIREYPNKCEKINGLTENPN